jgi:hypothetical protein
VIELEVTQNNQGFLIMQNTRHTLLMSVAAAAMIASVGVAFAQAPSPAPGAQQRAPAEKSAPMRKPQDATKSKAPDAGRTSGQAGEKSERKGGTAQRAQDNAKDELKPKGTRSETKSPGKATSDMKDDAKTKAKADTKTKADAKRPERSGDAKAQTTGQGAAGGAAKLSTEQRTTIRTVIKRQNVRPMTNVTFRVSIGAQVPRTVRFYPVPVELVQIYPTWRGYDYFLVGDQIIVVNPRTHEIVGVLDV